MNLSDYLLSLTRTAVPIAVGAGLTWAGTHWGVVLPDDLSANGTIALTALVVALYYAAVRGLEMRWPWFGKLLGAAKPPAYNPPTDAPVANMNTGGTS